jgi:hypothetical protein
MRFDDSLAQEAYQHGQTLQRLSVAVSALRQIQEIAAGGRRPKLPAIQRVAEIALDVLAASHGGVIDDMQPPELSRPKSMQGGAERG